MCEVYIDKSGQHEDSDWPFLTFTIGSDYLLGTDPPVLAPPDEGVPVLPGTVDEGDVVLPGTLEGDVVLPGMFVRGTLLVPGVVVLPGIVLEGCVALPGSVLEGWVVLPGRVDDLFVPGTAVGSVVVRGTLSVDCMVPCVVLPGIVVRCCVVPAGCVVLPGSVPVDCVVLPGCVVPGNVPGCTVLPGTVLGCVVDPALPAPVVGDVVEVAGVVCAKATVVHNNANPNMFIFNAFMTFIVK